ncbi:MAG: molybdate ABC transporter substrate-binding protein [Gloeomargaritaceae cyanobacterium C42_A2020_066]|nr:molybdate ABC transporter substrate-binding protein [Gloeomargaritaceae cyanobacterium C42_A2020_066]
MKRRAALWATVGLGTGLILPQRVWSQGRPAGGRVLVGAAASLQEVLTSLTPLVRQTYPKLTVDYTFAASGPLQRQIEQGAPIDLFVSAAMRQMEALATQKLIVPSSQRILATNRLVLVAPRSGTLRLTHFQDLARPAVDRVAMGDPRTVPAGQYAEETLRSLKLWEAVQPKLILGNSVRAVLAAVASGEVSAGLVYETDARTSNRVRVVATADPKLHSPIVYPAALVTATRNRSAAQAVLDFWGSSVARRTFIQFGFGLPPQ